MTQPREIFPFKLVTVNVAPDKSKVIEWTLDPRFCFEDEVVGFEIDMSRGGEWFRITESVITDMCLYVDQDKYRCGLRDDLYYRVVAVDLSGNEYNSKPTHIFECWRDKKQWLIAREVMRKEYLRFRQLPTAVEGKLLKRRQHGPKCTVCTDWDTGEVISPGCTNCYGTGFTGGYYNAIPYWLDLSGTSTKEQKTATFGVVDNKARIARGISYPIVSPNDVWVACKSNERFNINKVESTGETLIIPLIYRITLSELPQSDEAYKVPLEQDMADIHEDTSDITDDGLNEGITMKITW
jgi:hypothetical protein